MCYFVFVQNFSEKTMKKLLVLIALFGLLHSCNDGDIIVTTFDFDDASLETCGDVGAYVFYKINGTSAESISLSISTTDELFLESSTLEISLDGTANVVNYRNYNGEITGDYFCNNIPPTSPAVTADYVGASGLATLITVTTLDDNDTLEEDVSSELDTDNDGLLNFYDFDDDGDNVPTALEIGDDTENPQDSDGDGLKDYLDPDDDNDGVLTRYEAGGTLSPTSVITDTSVGPDYLNPAIANAVVIDEYRSHTYNRSSNISLFLSNLVLTNDSEEIIQESLDLGEKQNVVDRTETITPEF